MTALEMFRAGYDTEEIAAILRVTEAQALRLVTQQRSAERGLSDPYPERRSILGRSIFESLADNDQRRSA